MALKKNAAKQKKKGNMMVFASIIAIALLGTAFIIVLTSDSSHDDVELKYLGQEDDHHIFEITRVASKHPLYFVAVSLNGTMDNTTSFILSDLPEMPGNDTIAFKDMDRDGFVSPGDRLTIGVDIAESYTSAILRLAFPDFAWREKGIFYYQETGYIIDENATRDNNPKAKITYTTADIIVIRGTRLITGPELSTSIDLKI